MPADPDSIRSGIEFERTIWELLSDVLLSIHDPKDPEEKYKDKVNREQEPDLMFELDDGRQFWVDCMFRSSMFRSSVVMFSEEEARVREKMYGDQEDPTFIAVGLGGSPQRPERFLYGYSGCFNLKYMSMARVNEMSVPFSAVHIIKVTEKGFAFRDKLNSKSEDRDNDRKEGSYIDHMYDWIPPFSKKIR